MSPVTASMTGASPGCGTVTVATLPTGGEGCAGHTGRMRCFVGVWLPGPVREALAAEPRPEVPGVRWVAPASWHVTLAFAGGIDDVAVEAWVAALRDAATRVACPPEAVLGPATVALGRAVLCIPVAGLEAAAAAVRGEAAARDLAFDPKPFVGHLTLARARGRGRVPRQVVGRPMAARWSVAELCLVASRTTPEGIRYRTLAAATVG
jgi:RNA 2',3'-cyclic 3'-phosphodiesterase